MNIRGGELMLACPRTPWMRSRVMVESSRVSLSATESETVGSAWPGYLGGGYRNASVTPAGMVRVL